MAKLLKLRRGTTSQHSSFTGAEGEVTVDTTKDTIVVHDGSTAGGTPLAKESAVTAIPAVIDEDNMSSDSATRPPSQQSVKAYVDALPDVIDEDNFASNSATRPASQQSVKAYVDALPDVIDEDNMSSNSATRPPSQQSTKAYVDTTVSTHLVDEDNFASNSATKPPSQQSTKAYVDAADATKAPLASPALTGTATAVNLELSGNLVVNGTTTTVATTNTTVTDNLLELNSGATSNANDAGILIERGSTGDNAIIAWDESADRFTLGTTTSTNTATGNISVNTGTLAANIVGNVTGNTSGSSGSCTGTALVATSVTVTDESSDTTCFPLFADGATGNLSVRSGTNLTFNSSTGELEADIVKDSKGNLRHIIRSVKSSAYTLVADDSGKCIYISSGGVTVNANVFGTAGHAVTIVNDSGSDQTITQGSGLTIYNTSDASSGNRVLAGRGMATIWFASGTTAYISGAGLS